MKFKGILIVIAFLLLASGCSGTVDLNQARERNLSKNKGEIVFGIAWPFADKNDGFKEGIELALDEINQTGVLGKKVRLVVEDDHSSVTTGLSIAQSFASNMELSAVIGHRSSVVTVPASKVYENAGLLLVAPISTAPNLTVEGIDRVIRMLPSDVQIGKRMADYAKSKSYQNIVILYANDEYGRGLANSFEDNAAASGIQIVDRISDYKDANDLKRLVDKWRLLNCDAIFLAESMPNGGNIISQLRDTGMEVPILGGDALDSVGLIEMGDHDAEGVVVASIFNPSDPRSEVSEFIAKYKNKYGAEPSKWAAQAYDSLKLLALSIEEAHSILPSDIDSAIKQMDSWSGVSGIRTFDSYGNPQEMPIVLKQVKSGKFEYLN